MIKILWVELSMFLHIMCIEAGMLLYWRYYVEKYVENWLVEDRADEYAKACHARMLVTPDFTWKLQIGPHNQSVGDD